MSIFNRIQNTPDFAVPIFEGYDTEMNGDLMAIQEGYEDQLAVIEAIHGLDMEDLGMRQDIKSLKESGADDLEITTRMEKFISVTEGMGANIFAKIKTFLTNMLGKLKAFFDSVIRFMNGMIKSGKDFATKYEVELKSLKLDGFKVKMFDYTNLDSGEKASNFLTIADKVCTTHLTLTGGDSEAIDHRLNKFDEQKDEIFSELRGTYCGTSKLESNEYTEALYRLFRNGAKDESDKEEKSVNIGEIVSTLKTNTALTTSQDALKDCNTIFQKEIAEISKVEKLWTSEYGKKESSVEDRMLHQKLLAISQRRASAFSEAKTIALEYFRAWKEAAVARNSDYKSICMAAFRYKKKEA